MCHSMCGMCTDPWSSIRRCSEYDLRSRQPIMPSLTLTRPSLNFSLVSSTGQISSVDHLGIEVESVEEIATWKERLQTEGILERVEENTACCFARQDKLWFSDPDGNAWEVFTVHEQLPVDGTLSNTGCCIPNKAAKGLPSCSTSKAESPPSPRHGQGSNGDPLSQGYDT